MSIWNEELRRQSAVPWGTLWPSARRETEECGDAKTQSKLVHVCTELQTLVICTSAGTGCRFVYDGLRSRVQGGVGFFFSVLFVYWYGWGILRRPFNLAIIKLRGMILLFFLLCGYSRRRGSTCNTLCLCSGVAARDV